MGTNVSNNVNTTERTYKPQASQSGQKTSAQNSIYDAKQPQTPDNGSTENKNISTEIDKILEKICEKFKKYGLTVEDLKKNPLIQKVCNLTDEQLAKIPDKEKAVKMYVECLETAIKDSIVDGKIDLNQVSKLSNDYFIAVSTGWTIEGFKKHNSTHEKHSLIDRLIASGCLPKDATLENTPEPQIKRAIRRYFRQIIKYAESNPSEKDIKLQLQTFGRLLINSSEQEKALFLEVVQTLYQRNRLKGLEALFASCKTDKTRQAVAAEAGSPEYIKELTTTPDADGQVMSEDDATAASALIAENQSEEDRTQAHEDYDNARAEWFEKNKDALEALDQKLKKAEAEGVEPERADALLVGVGIFCDPLGRLPAHGLLGDQAAAGGTGPRGAALQAPDLFAAHALGLGLEVDGVEHDLAVLPALGAAVAPAFLCALVEAGLDVAGALDGRGRDLDGLGVVEGRLTGLGQRPRVALGAGARGPAVTLVADDVACGGGCQRRGAVGAGQREHTARERLLEDGVAAVLGLDIVHLCLQGLAVPDHGSDTQPAELPGVVDGRVDVEDAAGVLVDDVADDVELELRLADLRGGHHDYFVHLRIRKGPHGLLEVRGALGTPRAGLG